FGYPISEQFTEQSDTDGRYYTVQYFQRNRFEFHPENQPPYDVLLGLLGKNLMEMQGLVNAWGPPIQGAPTPVEPIMPPARPAIGGSFLTGPTVGDGMIVQAYYQDRTRIMNMINDLNYTWIKQQIEWKETEVSKNQYTFDELDRVVNVAQAHNVKILVNVTKAPTSEPGGLNGFPKDPTH